MQEQNISIKEAARRTGLTEHTLRYYEQIGLVKIGRSKSGYRNYSPHDIAWIAFIKRLKITGMSLRDIEKLIYLRNQGDHTLSERRSIVVRHRQLVVEKISQLQEELKRIDQKIDYYNDLIK